MFLKKAPDGTMSFRLSIDQERDCLNSCFLLKTAVLLDKGRIAFTESWLRSSWVQLPPGAFLTTRELLYCSELVFDSCRINSAAMVIFHTELVAPLFIG
jgi:hypothetical protein